MYKKLLISAGGGIISKDQQSEQNSSVTLAIGLGGTGINCLRSLKKEVYDRIKPDGDNLTPTYKHIKFLAIDTDKAVLSDRWSINSIDEETEFLNLSCNNIGALLTCASVLKNRPELKWLKAKVTQQNGEGIWVPPSGCWSCGGVRQIGRLLFFQNCTRFCTKFEDMLKSSISDLPDNTEINIHIFTGLCGGTGSGIFLDVCYVIQHIISQMNLEGRTQTCGYFFLPDVNLNRVVSSNVQEFIKSNGFAAMKELDYCMNFDINGGEWNQEYDGFTIKTIEPPVKLAHLITAIDSNDAISKNPYDYSMHVAVDYVINFLIKPKFSLRKHIELVKLQESMVRKRHGAGYRYCIFGASNAYLPYKEIITYLTSKIFEGFARIDHQLPSDNDIDLFVQTTGLKYEDLCKDLRENVLAVPLFEVDTTILGVIPPVLGQQMRDYLAKIGGQLAENKNKMLQDSQTGNLSLIYRVRKKIMEISQQPDKGPYYGGAILHSVEARDLQNRIEGYIEQNSRNLNIARADMTLRDQSVAQTLRELQNSNVLNRKGRGRAYVQAVQSYFRQQADIEFYATLGDVLIDFKRQVSDLYTQEFAVFENVFRQLESTFSANLEVLSNPVAEENDYAIKLITIQDLKDSLDASVKEMRIDDLISGFVNYMLDNTEIWLAQDESKIAHAVSGFFLGQLQAFTSKTIIDYLKIKFDTSDPQLILDRVYNQIMLPLADKALPLFWLDRTKYQIPPSSELGFCTIPKISQEIKGAAAKFNITIRPSFCTDRISFLIFDCAIPMFAYKGVDNYRGAKRIIGAHIYEGATGDDRDWRLLHDITPLSCIDVSALSDSLKRKSEIYDVAFEKGIVAHRALDDAGTFDFIINKLNEEIYTSEINEINDAIASGDLGKLKTTYDKYKNLPASLEVSRLVKNFGSIGCEDIVAKDIVVSSQILINIIIEELGKIQKRNSMITSMKEKIALIEFGGSVVQ